MQPLRPGRHVLQAALAGLVLLALQARGGMEGRSLADMTGARLSPALPLLQDADTLAQLGDDGPPAWTWPDLPGTEVTWRVELDVPRRLRLHGLLVGSAGTAQGLADTLRLTLRDQAGTVLLDSGDVRLGGGGLQQVLRIRREIVLEGGERLQVDIRSTHPARAPWLTADDDCHTGNTSWLQAPAMGAAFQPLDRDLNVRALGEWVDGDQQPPQIRTAESLVWSRVRATLPLRVRVRDESGIDSVWVSSPDLPEWSQGLQRRGRADADASWQEWSAALQPAGFVPFDVTSLTLEVGARDSLGNTDALSLPLAVEEVFHWSAGGGRADQGWRPDFPLTPGSALALRVPLAELIQESNLLSAIVTGVRLQARGPGELLLRLVRDNQGRPANSNGNWVELADPLITTLTEACPGPQELSFTLNAQGQFQGTQAWLLLDYSLPSHQTEAPGPLLEWSDPGDDGEAEPDSWAYAPLERQWNAIPAGRLLLEPLLEAQSCDYAVPFLADFDASFASLLCWQASHASTSQGWISSASGTANSPMQPVLGCFFPSASEPHPTALVVDPDSLQSGHFLFVNSDAQERIDADAAQLDTLLTPWLSFSDGARLSFSSCLGIFFGDDARVLWRTRINGVASSWVPVLGNADMMHNDPVFSVCDTLHAVWARIDTQLAPPNGSGEGQVAFAYGGDNSTGWAIDSVRVDPAGAPGPSPWDGPQTAAAEIGRVYPNPFNPEALIPYRLLRDGAARLEVFNLLGQRVALLVDEPDHHAGSFNAVFRPRDLASGVYFARLEAAGAVDTRRLVYLK